MKAAFVPEDSGLTLREVPTPAIGENEILVRMCACGVCGTDLEKTHGTSITSPVLGHEVSGIVERAGSYVKDVKVEDRVIVHHHVPCGYCDYCKNSLETLCEAYPKSNLDPCGFAEYIRVPASLLDGGAVHRISSTLSFDAACQVEPTACCVRALRKVKVEAGKTAAVFGLGPAGLTHVELLRLFGIVQVLGVDVVEKRRGLALMLGADFTFDPRDADVSKVIVEKTGGGVDYAIVATGNPNAIGHATQSVRKGGKVLLFGAPARGTQVSFDVSRMFIREITFLSSYSASEFDMRVALDLIEQRRINPSKMITHRFPLSQITEAFHAAENASDVGKVIVEGT